MSEKQEKKQRQPVHEARECIFRLGPYGADAERAFSRLREERIIPRIWGHDHRVWKEDPKEITNRLGWLHCPENMPVAVSEIGVFVEKVRQEGFTSALLLGMGGSSLAPEMFRHTFGVREGYLDLSVLDSTDPGAVLDFDRQLDPAKTLYIVSTKSGGTVETLSFLKYFFTRAAGILGKAEAGAHFTAITDPGSSLEAMAGELGFRKVFRNDPEIGGRYSALSYFGLVPAALVGVDLPRLLDRAIRQAQQCKNDDNAALRLGAAMGALTLQGRDKVTLISSPPISSFGAWVEQLIAESTGKDGKGILPVDGERLLKPEYYSADRLFVSLKLENDGIHDAGVRALEEAGHPVIQVSLRDLYDLGGECFRWEMATAVAGHLLGINPFDQPNVESAKILARNMVGTYREKGGLPEPKPAFAEGGIEVYGEISSGNLGSALREFLDRGVSFKDKASGRSYVAIQAYLKPDAATEDALQELRTGILKTWHMATTLGYGPRFLHSTGQLHKGDAGWGLFIQITADMPEDAPIPDRPGEEVSSLSFGVLKAAQALGDRQALIEAGRAVIGFHIRGDAGAGIKRLAELLATSG